MAWPAWRRTARGRRGGGRAGSAERAAVVRARPAAAPPAPRRRRQRRRAHRLLPRARPAHAVQRFVMNLLLVNLVACASLLPLLLLDSLHGLHGLHGQDVHVLCAVSEGVAAGYCTASILGVLLIAGTETNFTNFIFKKSIKYFFKLF